MILPLCKKKKKILSCCAFTNPLYCGPLEQEEGVLQPLLDCAQERWRVATDLRPVSTESGLPQAPVQDAHAETHADMCLASRLVHGDRPEGHVLSCLDFSSAKTVSLVRL